MVIGIGTLILRLSGEALVLVTRRLAGAVSIAGATALVTLLVELKFGTIGIAIAADATFSSGTGPVIGSAEGTGIMPLVSGSRTGTVS